MIVSFFSVRVEVPSLSVEGRHEVGRVGTVFPLLCGAWRRQDPSPPLHISNRCPPCARHTNFTRRKLCVAREVSEEKKRLAQAATAAPVKKSPQSGKGKQKADADEAGEEKVGKGKAGKEDKGVSQGKKGSKVKGAGEAGTGKGVKKGGKTGKGVVEGVSSSPGSSSASSRSALRTPPGEAKEEGNIVKRICKTNFCRRSKLYRYNCDSVSTPSCPVRLIKERGGDGENTSCRSCRAFTSCHYKSRDEATCRIPAGSGCLEQRCYGT